MNKKILASIMVVGLLGLALGWGTYALFSDTETSEGNMLTAGTSDLTVNDENDPITLKFDVSNIAPGYDSGYLKWKCKNVGTLDGTLSVVFSIIVNSDNGQNEPELATGDDDSDVGELGQYLKYTIGWAPYSWSVPSTLKSEWQTGPQHPWGTPGLNGLGGTTYNYGTLAAGAEIGFFMKLSLDENLRIWDGTKWIEVDDNIIQSDSVEFDITFRLEQVT